ncbi:hypothetical protein QBC43DRAFT_62221 [Cladorrhinum sp. PSN259]|nr:hypothetical protein QBC43DRAFT_62221 [Cladorrhinum sp. PSN259]
MDNHHSAAPPHLLEDHQDEDDFFTRNNLPPSTKSQCHEFVHALYPNSRISEHESQGCCSYTLQLSDPCLIIQFRPALHRLDLEMTSGAHRLFPLLTPETKLLGVLSPVPETDSQRVFVYSHSVLLGASLSSLTLTMMQKYALVKSLARVFITSYNNCRRPGGDASSSSSSASCENFWRKGKVGSSLASRVAHFARRPPCSI